jgi:hypothetical protein
MAYNLEQKLGGKTQYIRVRTLCRSLIPGMAGYQGRLQYVRLP